MHKRLLKRIGRNFLGNWLSEVTEIISIFRNQHHCQKIKWKTSPTETGEGRVRNAGVGRKCRMLRKPGKCWGKAPFVNQPAAGNVKIKLALGREESHPKMLFLRKGIILAWFPTAFKRAREFN